MTWYRVRGSARIGATLLSAALLAAVVVPSPASAAQPTRHLTARVLATTSHVDARIAARMPRRIVPASAQLPALARPSGFPVSTRKVQPSAKTVKPAVVIPPTLSVTHVTRTQQERDVNVEPPDPWVVANASYVISSSNGVVRIMNRSNVVLANIPTYALFDTDSFHFESDPRILWDTTHNRWVGVVVTYDDPTYVDCSLTLIVSDTANPLGTWTVHRFGYGNELPDYPGIGSSTDKVVLTSNLYGNLAQPDPTLVTNDGTSVLATSWASLIAGGTVAGYKSTLPADFGLRPVRNAGTPEADVPLIYENATSGDITYERLTGAAASASITGIADTTIPNGVETFAHSPRQPGGTVTDQLDGRIPDATYWGDSLFFARIGEYKWDGTNTDLVVEQFTVPISSLATTPAPYFARWGTTGEDYWMPGVGISSGGGFFLSFMRSSSTVAPEAWITGGIDGQTFNDPTLIATSQAPYSGTRWGDFMGITPDPGGTMTVWAATEVSNADGYWQEVVARGVLDDNPPTTPGLPAQSLVAGTTLGKSTVPIKVSWTAAADPESGVQHYVAEDYNDDVTTAGLSFVRSHPWLAFGTAGDVTDQFHVLAIDDGGKISSWSPASDPLSPIVFQQTLSYTKYSSGWSSQSSSAFSGGSTKYSSKAGATATFKMSGRSFAWVSYRASNRGKAKVYVDGHLKATISLKSSATAARYIPYAITFSTSGTHTIKIVVVSGRVDVDGFVVLR